ncbi:nucleoside-diphosphate-sugar epimerase [Pseudovirgaria hyperparasitica]|uniref:Nucleoside-diphosphate-sugar epimerase n=1 Tax=Pseudovirgaria hyperparasitica TaxID=470096 RepID=A0A6A6W979_9PEZI|nr:nucleoside-diphosphate-sugar epimerase [Pseudovirgaria hyperparasitica]KAF2759402.1 nucleoside-diphosphate-sugar epimerase [Pseudovirgaria hyperparasitica]
MVHLVLTGATGLVGSGVLDAMLAMQNVTKISIISRRPVAMAKGTDKTEVILKEDFGKWDAGEEALTRIRDAKGIVWALGVSQNDVDKEKYIEITKDYPIKFIEAFAPKSPFNFVYVSGEGATLTPGVFTPIFGRVKGETEAAILEQHKRNPELKAFSVRPAMVDETDHPAIHEYVPRRPAYQRVLRPVLFPTTKMLLSGFHSPTKPLGRWMAELAAGDGRPLDGAGVEGDGRTISNKGFRRLAGLD